MATNQQFHILKGKSVHELEQYFINIGEPRYRAEQAFRRINKDLQNDLDCFSEFPQRLREELKANGALPQLSLVHSIEDKATNATEKVIFNLQRSLRFSAQVESVWIPSMRRNTVCISSQMGCSLNCSFCATATLPFRGNLQSWEILEQVYEFIRRRPNERLSNVVFMGMGEPLYNYENVMRAAHILHHPFGLNLGARHITISTAGVVPAIERFIRAKEPFNLAISLNHTNDKGRSEIMNINRKFHLESLLKIARRFTKELDRRITFEYVLIPNVNMDGDTVRQLIKIGRSVRCRINLIPLNTELGGWRRPSRNEVYEFQSQLLDAGINVFNRGSPGLGINAACGMLALKEQLKKPATAS